MEWAQVFENTKSVGEFDLSCRFDARDNFYGKAKVEQFYISEAAGGGM